MNRLVLFCCMTLITATTTAADNSDLEQHLSGLSSPNWQLREQSAEALGSAGSSDKSIVSALTGALNDDDSRVRQSAANALGAIGDDAAKSIPALMKLFNDADSSVVAAAADAVGLMGSRASRALPELEKLLVHNDARVRAAATTSLGRLGSRARKSAAALGVQLKDKSPVVRAAAAHSLAQLGSQAASQSSQLVQALHDTDTQVRDASSRALVAIGKDAVPVLIRALTVGEPTFLQTVVDTLGNLGAVAVPRLLERLHDDQELTLVRQYSAMALARIGSADKRVVPALLKSLNDEDAALRVAATDGLGEIGGGASVAVPRIVELSADQNEPLRVREVAIAALAGIAPHSDAVNEALIVAVADGDSRIYEAAVAALVAIRATANTEQSGHGDVMNRIEQLQSTSDSSRIEAARRIGEIGPYAVIAVPELTEILADRGNSIELRSTAATSLGLIGPGAETAVPELIRTLEDKNDQMRDIALIALNRIGPQTTSVPALLQAMRSGDLAGRAAAQEKIQSFVRSRLQSWQPLLRQSAAPVLHTWIARHEALYGVVADDAALQQSNNESIDFFSVLGGNAAIRETMQLDLIAEPRTGLSDELDIPLREVSAANVESHPFDEMLKESPAPLRRVKLAELVPADHFFAWFRNVEALDNAITGASRQFLELESALNAKSVDYDLKQRYLALLGLGENSLDEVRTLGAVGEIAVVAPDLFLIDGTDLTIIAKVASVELAQSVLQAISLEESAAAGYGTRVLEDGRSTYWALRDDKLILSNSAREMEAILGFAANGGEDSLGRSSEFLYMQQQLGIDEQTEAYGYFSDPFIRHIVSPESKIAQLRRVQARAEMEMMVAGAMLFLLDGNRHTPSKQQLIAQGYLPSYFELRDYTISDTLIVSSEQFGSIAEPAPLSEISVGKISKRERDAYQRYVDQYSEYWSQFFDPIAMRIDQVDDNTTELTTFIVPLLDSALFDQVRDTLVNSETGRRLEVPTLSPQPMLMLSLNLSDDLRLEISEGVTDLLAEYTSVNAEIFDSIGSGVHLAVQDSTPIVALGSGDVWGALSQEMLQMDGFDSMLPFLLSLATQPSSILIELDQPKLVQKFLADAVEHRSSAGGDGELHQVQDKDAWIYTLSVENFIQIHLGIEIKGNFLVISNMPWSAGVTIESTQPTALNGALLQLNLDQFVAQLPALHTKVFTDYRAAAVDGMGYLFPLLAIGISDSVSAAQDKHRELFGFRPVHPHSGGWLWSDGFLTSTQFGTADRPVQPAYSPGDRNFGVFPALSYLGVNMQLEETGLRATIRWRK